MGDVLGLGISHYPGFTFSDSEMFTRMKQQIVDGKTSVDQWPGAMQQEWGADEGMTFAARHREQFVEGARLLRRELDAFRPEIVFIFSDDHYENFHADIVPPFALYIRDNFAITPFVRGTVPKANIWGRDENEVMNVAGNRTFGNRVARELIDRNFDIPYCYEGLHLDGLCHAFYGALLYLDYDQNGWPYPIQPVMVNAYGAQIGNEEVYSKATSEYADVHIPGPTPTRAFDLGRAIAHIAKESDLRVALVASSSWSHAFLTEKNDFLHADVETDGMRFEQMRNGEYAKFASCTRAELEAAGEHKMLNWMPLFGAMTELNAGRPKWCDFMPTYIINSNKVSVVFNVV